MGSAPSREDVEAKRMELVANVRSLNQPIRILVVGSQGVGKTCLINTIAAALSPSITELPLTPAPPNSVERATRVVRFTRVFLAPGENDILKKLLLVDVPGAEFEQHIRAREAQNALKNLLGG